MFLCRPSRPPSRPPPRPPNCSIFFLPVLISLVTATAYRFLTIISLLLPSPSPSPLPPPSLVGLPLHPPPLQLYDPHPLHRLRSRPGRQGVPRSRCFRSGYHFKCRHRLRTSVQVGVPSLPPSLPPSFPPSLPPPPFLNPLNSRHHSPDQLDLPPCLPTSLLASLPPSLPPSLLPDPRRQSRPCVVSPPPTPASSVTGAYSS